MTYFGLGRLVKIGAYHFYPVYPQTPRSQHQ